MTELIFSADDFGLTEEVTKGIAKGMTDGVVTRTSAMMCTEGAQWIKQYAVGLENRIGIHLQLTDGVPLSPQSQVKSLVDENGKFPASWRLLTRVNEDEIRLEWEAQIQAFLALGLTPTHIDTHHNVHRFRSMFTVYCELAKKYNLPTRPLSDNMLKRLKMKELLSTDICVEEWEGVHVTVDSLVSHVMGAKRKLEVEDCIMEVMCHPGYVDDNLRSRSHYLEAREKELEVLCDPKLPLMLREYGFEVAQSSILNQTA